MQLIEDKRGGSQTINRREEILAVAARLFRERGYTSTSLDDITREIGITKPAIYYYFKAKEDILYEICVMHINNITQQGKEIAAKDLSITEKVMKMIESQVYQFHDNRDIAEAYLREAAHLSLERRKKVSSMLKQYEAFIREHVDRGIAEGVFRPVNSKHVVRGIGQMCNWVGNWYDPKGPDDISVIANAYIDFVRHGLLPVDGEKKES